jgi:hypothetical protein
MPIEYEIDHERRRVVATAHGSLTGEEIFAYQREVWSRSDIARYDELVDMSDVQRIVEPTAQEMRDLAHLSAEMDAPDGASKFAIVAPQDVAFGLGRMYGTYRIMDPHSKKEVAVFRSRRAAMTWLGDEDQAMGPAVHPMAVQEDVRP